MAQRHEFTPQQRMAWNHPTYLAEETAHPRFARRIGSLCSVVITINAGYE